MFYLLLLSSLKNDDMKVCRILCFVLFLFLINSCNKCDLGEGTVYIKFENPPDYICIYTLDNKQTEIFRSTSTFGKEIEVSLNVGNYELRPFSNNDYIVYSSIGFQVQSKKRVTILYSKINDATILQ